MSGDSGLLAQATLLFQIDEDVIVLSDWPESLYQESHHSQNKPFVCFYSNDDTYFVSLDWVEPYGKQVQVKLHLFFSSFVFPFSIYMHPI
jgi:hypothetical protein